jgi:hypothetical protein
MDDCNLNSSALICSFSPANFLLLSPHLILTLGLKQPTDISSHGSYQNDCLYILIKLGLFPWPLTQRFAVGSTQVQRKSRSISLFQTLDRCTLNGWIRTWIYPALAGLYYIVHRCHLNDTPPETPSSKRQLYQSIVSRVTMSATNHVAYLLPRRSRRAGSTTPSGSSLLNPAS